MAKEKENLIDDSQNLLPTLKKRGRKSKEDAFKDKIESKICIG